ncbi:hypothetical protein [Caloranaerobacter sp. DY30410]|uniref:hypothetical protein n=1 Tax=Caloranaerobacter sp. DY30410 TaxID=3238305 RepID=UPI003CFF014C
MKRKKYIFIGIIFLSLFYSKYAYSETITLDGYFNDWKDKPILNDTIRDELPRYDIVKMKWYVDTSKDRLYLFVKRKYSKNKWTFRIYFSSDIGIRILKVSYNPKNRFVNVKLYNEKNFYIWQAKGKWGDSKKQGKRLEFYVPLKYLVGSTTSGYEVKLKIKSRFDNIPNKGMIVISTVNTYTSFILLIIVIFILTKITTFFNKENL